MSYDLALSDGDCPLMLLQMVLQGFQWACNGGALQEPKNSSIERSIPLNRRRGCASQCAFLTYPLRHAWAVTPPTTLSLTMQDTLKVVACTKAESLLSNRLKAPPYR